MAAARASLCALVLLALSAASALDQPSCPDLFLRAPAAARDELARVCAGPSATSCDACQCALVRAVTPTLVRSGKILASEAWMASSINTIADVLSQCKRELVVQLLENTNATLSQLSSFDACATDAKAVSQCVSGTSGADAGAALAAAPAPAPAGTDGTTMELEVLSEACAAAVAGSSDASQCPSAAAAAMVAGAPLILSTDSGMGLMMVPPTAADASVLRISGSNTRGPVTWRANCWCDETWDPVCDATTRKLYPSACSARCQGVSQVVPCGSLEPLVNQTMAGNTAVFVVDQSLTSAATAFSGPIPAEASEDSQSFYYYYEDDADDTQDALEIAGTLAEAFLAAKFGDEVEAVDAVATALPSAVRSGAFVNITAADGPADNTTTTTAPGVSVNPLAALRNLTISRQRVGLDRRAQEAPQRRNVSVPSVPVGSQPPSPTWMLTSAPGYSADVYQRDAERTSRILASLMAASKEAKDTSRAATLVISLGPAMDGVVKAAAGAMSEAERQPAAAGGALRSAGAALGNLTASLYETMLGNMTASLMGNATRLARNSSSNSSGPTIRSFAGLAQRAESAVAAATTASNKPAAGGWRFGSMLQELRSVLRKAPAVRATQQQGAGPMMRQAAALTNATSSNSTMMSVNGTATASNSTRRSNTTTTRQAASQRKAAGRHLLFL